MLTVAGLRDDYHAGRRSPTDIIARTFATIDAEGLSPVWISLAHRNEAGATVPSRC